MTRKKWIVVAFFLALFSGMLIWGLFGGESNLVLENAKNLCLS